MIYGNRFIQAIITPFGYVLVGALIVYEFGENIVKLANRKIDETISYSAAKEAANRGR